MQRTVRLMEYLVSATSQHGYSILFVLVFLEAIGFPVPAAIALLIAGGASAHGPMQPAASLATALAAMLLGDTILFLLGRYTGWALLGFICRLSLNPESCILRSADAFFKRGKTVLIFAKFVPGINTMAAPLAGSMNMRATAVLSIRFWRRGAVYAGLLGRGLPVQRFPGTDREERICGLVHYLGWSIAILPGRLSGLSRIARVEGMEAWSHHRRLRLATSRGIWKIS